MKGRSYFSVSELPCVMFNFQYDAKLLKLQSAKAQSGQASNVNSDIFRKVCRKRIVHGIPSLLDRATYLLYDTVSVQPLMPLGLIQPFVGPFPLGKPGIKSN